MSKPSSWTGGRPPSPLPSSSASAIRGRRLRAPGPGRPLRRPAFRPPRSTPAAFDPGPDPVHLIAVVEEVARQLVAALRRRGVRRLVGSRSGDPCSPPYLRPKPGATAWSPPSQPSTGRPGLRGRRRGDRDHGRRRRAGRRFFRRRDRAGAHNAREGLRASARPSATGLGSSALSGPVVHRRGRAWHPRGVLGRASRARRSGARRAGKVPVFVTGGDAVLAAERSNRSGRGSSPSWSSRGSPGSRRRHDADLRRARERGSPRGRGRHLGFPPEGPEVASVLGRIFRPRGAARLEPGQLRVGSVLDGETALDDAVLRIRETRTDGRPTLDRRSLYVATASRADAEAGGRPSGARCAWVSPARGDGPRDALVAEARELLDAFAAASAVLPSELDGGLSRSVHALERSLRRVPPRSGRRVVERIQALSTARRSASRWRSRPSCC